MVAMRGFPPSFLLNNSNPYTFKYYNSNPFTFIHQLILFNMVELPCNLVMGLGNLPLSCHTSSTLYKLTPFNYNSHNIKHPIIFYIKYLVFIYLSEMGFSSSILVKSLLVMLFMGVVSAQLSTNFYSKSCPNVFRAVKSAVQSAISKETRMGASLLRLHFHDCFVNVNFRIHFFNL